MLRFPAGRMAAGDECIGEEGPHREINRREKIFGQQATAASRVVRAKASKRTRSTVRKSKRRKKGRAGSPKIEAIHTMTRRAQRREHIG